MYMDENTYSSFSPLCRHGKYESTFADTNSSNEEYNFQITNLYALLVGNYCL